ncbi:MAG TPA: TIR domain-containing protein [Kofleriaceae bacterium]|jgi:WD40 repeat protein|nr:TIR domain-containing protein [Kofleriaceae bacterium]
MIEATGRARLVSELFILHAEPDTEFIRGFLLRAIGIDEADPRLILPSKFVPGRPIFEELARAVRTSRFTILVISRATVADQWSEIGRVLAGTLAASGEQRLIPLYLEEVDVELTVRYLVPLEFRDRAEWPSQAAKLRRLLDQPAAPRVRPVCPYPGLEPFSRHEADLFFGREDQVRGLVRDIEAGQHRLCIIGPSGSGKSSLVQAGLLPRLERGGPARAPFLVVSVRVTAQPTARLAEALAIERLTAISTAVTDLLASAGRSRFMVFLDQLEELFVLAASDERERFIAVLHELMADARCTVIVALRADFFGSLMESALWDDFERGRVHVTPLGSEDLRRAIEEPALRVGVYLDRALTQRLVADTAAEPGALPLLQATMLELWDALEEGIGGETSHYLTLVDYERLGDGGSTTIATALARRANATMNQMTAVEQAIARRLLLSLVAFGEGTRHTRRQQAVAVLRAAEDPAPFDRVVAMLVDRRLLTADHRRDAAGHDEATLDLSHEALIAAWPELRMWIETERGSEERKRALAKKVEEWLAFGDVKLLDAVELLDAERWLDRDGARAGSVPRLRELVEHSRAALDAVRRQRDDAQRLLARSYQEHGRQLMLQGRPMRALPYLVAARKVDDERGVRQGNLALRWLFAEAARNLPVTTVVHRAAIERAGFSPDGIHAVTVSRDRTALVWNASTGALCARFDHPDGVLDAGFSPDGKRLVTAGADHLARVWDVASGELWLAPLGHGHRVHLARFSPDGSRLLTVSWDRTLRIWDAASGMPVGPPIEQPANITVAQFHPDGHWVLVAGKHREARVYDAATGGLVHALAHGEIVRSAEWSPAGTRIVTASSDRTARVWDAATGAVVATVTHGAPVSRAGFAPDGQRIIAICEDHARLWSAGSGEPVSPVIRHADRVIGAAFSADGTRVVTASWDRTARIWDVASGMPWSAPFEHAREVESAAFAPDGRHVLTTSADGTARIWDATIPLSSHVRLAHAGKWVASVAFDPRGERVVTAGADGTARVWQAATGDALVPALGHDARVSAASFSPDGARIVSISANLATVWSATTGSRLAQLGHAPASMVTCAAFDPEGTRIVTAGNDQQVKIWDAGSGQLLEMLAHPRAVTCAAFGPDGTCLVTTCADGRARIWQGGEARWLMHDDTVSHAAFRRDGRRLVTASKDRTARVWDVASAAPCTPSIRHPEAVTYAAFSPDGNRLVTLSGNTVRLWDAGSGKPVLDPLEHRGRVHAVSFTGDGALLAVAVEDGHAEIWDLGSGKPLALPFTHPARVNDVAFSADGTRLATASGDAIARVWQLAFDTRTLAEWLVGASRCPYDLLDGILVERSLPDSLSRIATSAGDAGQDTRGRQARS